MMKTGETVIRIVCMALPDGGGWYSLLFMIIQHKGGRYINEDWIYALCKLYICWKILYYPALISPRVT